MSNIVISGTGLYTPPDAVSNEKLVQSYNAHVDQYNALHADEIEAGNMEAKQPSTVEFIEKASGIKNRYLMEGEGPTDVNRMRPGLSKLADETAMGTPVQVKMALEAAKDALNEAGLTGEDIDLVIISSSLWERFVPSMACELQQILGAGGFAFDMAMGCSSATFGMSTAMDTINSGMANKALVITAEYISPAMNYVERDSHFIFGDAAVAMVLEREEETKSQNAFRINSRKLFTQYSTNIRAAFGARTLVEDHKITDADQRFQQEGRVVFRELLPMVINLVQGHLAEVGKQVSDFKRFWLHQANINMNMFATKKLLNEDPTQDKAPIVLDEYANTAGAGCMIAFHKYKNDFQSGDEGVICSFGASYSIGCMCVEKV
ncbi:beta-ketoacyl-ACP synthase III [Kordiimonas sediminis]|uniref:Beta-ketoacyl-ACP synthase III n=1 Tax=Kordiimonas sediminis TaxID=1735581 RepID=A0A919AT91_9PROT|nr:beta-ketoacyl-ACP synthase III [Kordiimonas sediminis]GHF22983.1 beta-ketoacyl-ACP synthase III [Kordiimonas sediminis]